MHRLSVLEVTCALRAVFKDASMIVTGMTFFDILAAEIKYIYLKNGNMSKSEACLGVSARIIEVWQSGWNQSGNGR